MPAENPAQIKNSRNKIVWNVITNDKRKSARKSAPGSDTTTFREKRSVTNKFVLEDTINFFIKHVEDKIRQHNEDIKFVHNKKFAILASTFTVLTLITTFTIQLADVYSGETSVIVLATMAMALVLFLLVISAVNYSIIKYLIDLKLTHIIALRGLNCNRQALHCLMFAKWERKLPKELPTVESDSSDLSGTILDKNTKFWGIFGRHEKYPLNNVELRERYLDVVKAKNGNVVKDENGKEIFIPKKGLWLQSSDIFPIYVIALFTYAMLLAPFIAFFIEVGQLNISPYIAMTVAIFIFVWGFTFGKMVKKIVDKALYKIVDKLSCDETFRFEKYQKEITSCN